MIFAATGPRLLSADFPLKYLKVSVPIWPPNNTLSFSTLSYWFFLNTPVICPVKEKTQGGDPGSSVNVLLQLLLNQQPLIRSCLFLFIQSAPHTRHLMSLDRVGDELPLSSCPRSLLTNQTSIRLSQFLLLQYSSSIDRTGELAATRQ